MGYVDKGEGHSAHEAGRSANGSTHSEVASAAPSTREDLFVFVPDGRVSRRHCQLTFSSTSSGASCPSKDPEAVLCDLSSNGTFLNGAKIPRNVPVPLHDGDRIALVLSVAPLLEQAFVFHSGHPLAHMLAGPPPAEWVGWRGPGGVAALENGTFGGSPLGGSPLCVPFSCLKLHATMFCVAVFLF